MRTLDALAAIPAMGAPRHFKNRALEGIRMGPVKGFEEHLKAGIDVIRILHGVRDLDVIFLKEKL